MAIGSTRRRLSFFVMVFCYSRLCYLEFSLGEATEHFLQAHQNAFEFFGGVPAKVLMLFSGTLRKLGHREVIRFFGLQNIRNQRLSLLKL
jgi:transposase